VALWTNLYSGSGTGGSGASALALDASGNVFVTGYASNYPSGFDLATVAYSGTGRGLWTNRYNGPGNGNDSGQAIKADTFGRIFVTGYSAGTGTSNDFVTIAYSNSGQPLWTNRYDGPGSGDDRTTSMVLDNTGKVFVCGYSAGPALFTITAR
jgi:streptogramin lyase